MIQTSQLKAVEVQQAVVKEPGRGNRLEVIRANRLSLTVEQVLPGGLMSEVKVRQRRLN